MIVYVETSALTPLIKKEETSYALRQYFDDLIHDDHLLMTARLTETELRRVSYRYGAPQSQATLVLEALVNEEVTQAHYKLAGTIGSPHVRSLDALHVAVAVTSGCDAMITLDARLAEASDSVGIPVLDPLRSVARQQ